MAKSWADQIAGIGGPAGIGTILHIGAGRGTELPSYLASDASEIVLVEPDPSAFQMLQTMAQGDSRVRLLSVAVAQATGVAPLHCVNLPGAASLRDPSRLVEYFPGFRVLDTLDVETLSVADLLAQTPLPEGKVNVLILEAPGEEAVILDGLATAKALRRFDHLLIRTAAEALYPNSQTAAALLMRLSSLGYQIAYENRSDPDFPALHLTWRDEGSASAEAGMRAQLAALEAHCAALESENASLLSQIEGQRSEIEAKMDIVAKHGEAEAAVAKLTAELAEVKAARDAFWRERDKAREERDAAKEKVKALERRVQELEFKADLARAEFHRSEGQVALIKDLLLREGGL